jgi:hypothetical protein
MAELYLHSPIRLHGVVLKLLKLRDNLTFLLFSISQVSRSSSFYRADGCSGNALESRRLFKN